MAKFLNSPYFRSSNWSGVLIAYWWLMRTRWRIRRSAIRDLLDTKASSEYNSGLQTDIDQQLIQCRVRVVNFAARRPISWANCLHRSIALRDWLAKDGIFTTLRAAARMSDGKLQAHAWVEHRGEVMNDSLSATSQFVPFELDSNRLFKNVVDSDRK